MRFLNTRDGLLTSCKPPRQTPMPRRPVRKSLQETERTAIKHGRADQPSGVSGRHFCIQSGSERECRRCFPIQDARSFLSCETSTASNSNASMTSDAMRGAFVGGSESRAHAGRTRTEVYHQLRRAQKRMAHWIHECTIWRRQLTGDTLAFLPVSRNPVAQNAIARPIIAGNNVGTMLGRIS